MLADRKSQRRISVQKWEYKRTVNTILDSELKELGAQGWELVAVTYSEHTGKTIFYFKRPLP
jgi:hypothetical protein